MKKQSPPDQKMEAKLLREALCRYPLEIPDGVKPDAIVRLLEQEPQPSSLLSSQRLRLRTAVSLAACAAAVAILVPVFAYQLKDGVNGSAIPPSADTCPSGVPETNDADRLYDPQSSDSMPTGESETAVEEGSSNSLSDQGPSLDGTSATLLAADSLQHLLSKGAVLVDLRNAAAYAAGHIAQAENLPLDQLQNQISTLVPQQKTIILYGDTEEICREASRRLTGLGYREVINLGRFTSSWTYPTETLPFLTTETSLEPAF